MLLKDLTTACGLPGFEEAVRQIIIKEIEGLVDSLTVDTMGNVIAHKNHHLKGPKIALSAHMDEVVLCITGYNSDGTLKFASWGVDPRLLPSSHVYVGKDLIPGVIGNKPIHLQKASERTTVYTIDGMYIDIGCESKEEVEKLVSKGDFAAFVSEYTEFGKDKIKAKALDDRVGCATIIEVLKMDLPFPITALFCVQEEVGLKGSALLSHSLEADLLLNIEGTISADMDGVEEHAQVTLLGKGPALSLMDRSSIYLKKYIEAIVAVAEKEDIPFQYRRSGMGGTDAGNFHLSQGGIPCIGLAVPCRYIHSAVSVMDKNDYNNLLKLIKAFIKEWNAERK